MTIWEVAKPILLLVSLAIFILILVFLKDWVENTDIRRWWRKRRQARDFRIRCARMSEPEPDEPTRRVL